MKTIVSFFLAGIFLLTSSFGQGKKSSPTDAEAFVKKAIEFYKSTDKAKALAEFSNASGKFVKGDLYIFVYDLNGKCLAHGGNPKMVGKDLIDMKDADGKSFVKERVSIIKTKGKGWQNYKWTNPESKQIESKTAYIEKCNDVIIGCGAYKK
jgi:signal transduction histidine kinase